MAQINKPNEYFNTKLYTGNESTNAITGIGFQPDWVWLKAKDSAGVDHFLFDSVRGVQKNIHSNTTDAEVTTSNSLTAFDSDGFTLGSDAYVNGSGQPHVSWNWKGGGTASSNTDGTITSSVSASTTSGFSVVSWTGTGATATVGHGLGTTPKLFIVKERSEARNCPVVTTAIDGSWDSLYLNLTDAYGNSPQSADSSVFNFTSSNEYNASGQTYIAYAFAEVKGFSKFGSYVGNGSTDGTFVYTGFKPAFVIFKSSSLGTTNWQLLDNKRNTFNPQNNHLRPNSSGAEFTNYPVDFLSNGFKFRNTDGDSNQSGETYIYMAFAENPLVGTNNIPTTAR
jgi:hypothetical protein